MNAGLRMRIAMLLVAGTTAALLLGCNRSSPSYEAFEYRPISFETGESVEVIVAAENGSVSFRGEPGRSSTAVTAILRASGRSLNQAQQRVEGLPVTMVQHDDHVELAFQPPAEASSWDEAPSVLFEVRLPMQAVIRVDSSNGTVQVDGIEGRIVIRMAQGTIDVAHAVGDIDLDVANGTIHVSGAAGDLLARGERSDIIVEVSEVSVDLETFIGDIEFSGRLVGREHRLQTSNGGITLRIPEASELKLEAEAITGRIESDLPFAGDTDGREWSAMLNAPTSLVRLRATNGWIRINASDNI